MATFDKFTYYFLQKLVDGSLTKNTATSKFFYTIKVPNPSTGIGAKISLFNIKTLSPADTILIKMAFSSKYTVTFDSRGHITYVKNPNLPIVVLLNPLTPPFTGNRSYQGADLTSIVKPPKDSDVQNENIIFNRDGPNYSSRFILYYDSTILSYRLLYNPLHANAFKEYFKSNTVRQFYANKGFGSDIRGNLNTQIIGDNKYGLDAYSIFNNYCESFVSKDNKYLDPTCPCIKSNKSCNQNALSAKNIADYSKDNLFKALDDGSIIDRISTPSACLCTSESCSEFPIGSFLPYWKSLLTTCENINLTVFCNAALSIGDSSSAAIGNLGIKQQCGTGANSSNPGGSGSPIVNSGDGTGLWVDSGDGVFVYTGDNPNTVPKASIYDTIASRKKDVIKKTATETDETSFFEKIYNNILFWPIVVVISIMIILIVVILILL